MIVTLSNEKVMRRKFTWKQVQETPGVYEWYDTKGSRLVSFGNNVVFWKSLSSELEPADIHWDKPDFKFSPVKCNVLIDFN
jgi:hypothetical protein